MQSSGAAKQVAASIAVRLQPEAMQRTEELERYENMFTKRERERKNEGEGEGEGDRESEREIKRQAPKSQGALCLISDQLNQQLGDWDEGYHNGAHAVNEAQI